MRDLPFVIPFGRHGASDRAARKWSSAGGRPGTYYLVENLPGEGGLAGVRRANELARAAGRVLLLGTPTTHVLLPARGGEAPLETFAPVAFIDSSPNVLLAAPQLGIRTVDALVARAEREPLTYASAGAGQTIHVCTALFCSQAGIRMTHLPYDAGSATAYADIAAGKVHVYFDNLLGCRERVERGEVVALAVSALERHADLPRTPTLAECGFPDHALDVWLGVFGHGVADLWPRPDARLVEAVQESAPRWRSALEIASMTPA